MPKRNIAKWKFRALLTETLPYEVPVIFGNDKLYKMLNRFEHDPSSPLDQEVKGAISKLILMKKPDEYSVPYNYTIAKDSVRTTTLSIAHPLWQTNACEFYCTYEGSLISSCSTSSYSIRRPIAVASLYSDKELSKNSISKTGRVYVEPAENEIDVSNIVSFFAYKKYNLLSKFYESNEFISLEKSFPFLRNIDVSKCFYNLYTHSVTWAVKSKEVAKQNRSAYSFEGRFDKLMQLCNYNETNGIVVGPEISRIFAEIIFQDIDRKIMSDLLKHGQMHDKHYAIRRYVDDYMVFSSSIENLDKIEKIIRSRLEEYKLYVNDRKVNTIKRPFITPLSMARRELRGVLRDLHSSIEDIAKSDDAQKSGRPHGVVRTAITDLRAIVQKYGIEFSAISGWTISALRKLIGHANKLLLESPTTESAERWLYIVRPVLSIAFYICATDMRVRTTYSLCQMLFGLSHVKPRLPEEVYERILSFGCEELSSIVNTYSIRPTDDATESIELFNLLIAGAFFLDKDFVRSEKIKEIFHSILNGRPTYFGYVSIKFCLLRDSNYFGSLLSSLNIRIQKYLKLSADPQHVTEDYLLLCDYLSAPDVDERDKRDVFNHFFGGRLSAAAIQALSKHVGFVDWTGLDVEHALRRKQLRPVYAMA